MNEDREAFHRVIIAPFSVPRPAPAPGVQTGTVVPIYRQEQNGPSPAMPADQALAAQVEQNTYNTNIVLAMITGATINAVCNGDGTITVTLTWGA